ncbi:HTH_Tnp_Tc3_2 domain-containing protein [Trichonephila clavipes]|nr:HTH_Tnp_Tc3_2 domain-containing protein [Trichonephila clavipes]
MRPLEDAGKNGCTVEDFSFMMVAVDIGPQIDCLDDRFTIRSAVTAPDSSLSTIRRVTRTRVSNMTIHRRLIERNLCSYRPLRHLPLTPAHCRARLQWYLVLSGWNHADRGCIVFSDESRFQLCPDGYQRRAWRGPGQSADPAFTIARPTGPHPGVMAWGPFYLNAGLLWSLLEAQL